MVVPIEVTELFKLNKFTEDIKWLIYKNLWKHLYCIKSEMKKELLSKANLINSINKFKNIFKPDEFLSYEEDIDGLTVRIINYTNYLDAIIYNLYMLFNNENNNENNTKLKFNYICSILDLDDENLTVMNIALVLDVDSAYADSAYVDSAYADSQIEKKKILLEKWNTLTSEEQIKFYENINEHDFNHYSMIV